MTRKQPTYLKLYMIRHAISCGNLAYSFSQLASDLYTDPELTQEGIRRAKALRPFLKRVIPKSIVVGASSLMRAQHTAQLLLDPKKLYIIPYISELGYESQSSTALAPTLQAELLPKNVTSILDYSYYNKATPVIEQNQVDAFLKWLGENMRQLTSHGQKSLVLVSHGGFMSELIYSYNKFNINIFNCDAIEIYITIQNKKAVIKLIQHVPYMPKDLYEWDLKKIVKKHGCRLAIKTKKTKKH